MGGSRYEFYSYQELAQAWKVAPKTLKNWVWLARRAGYPVVGRYRRGPGCLRREFLIRGDTAVALFRRHIALVGLK